MPKQTDFNEDGAMSLQASAALNTGSVRAPQRVSVLSDMGIRDNRISRRLFPANRARDLSVLGDRAIQYVSNIRDASQEMLGTLQELYEGDMLGRFAHVVTDIFSPSEEPPPEIGEVTIAVRMDFFFASEIVKRIVSNFNSFRGEAVRNSRDPKAETLAGRLETIARIHSERLADIGIDITPAGDLEIDSERLQEAAESGRVEEFFTEEQGRYYGFSSQLERLAYNVSENTYNFVSRDTRGDNLTENFAYTPPGVTVQYTAFNVGLLFDVTF